VTVQAQINWGPRTRQVTTPLTTGPVPGPSSALSAVITLAGANAAGGDLTFTVDRPEGFLGGVQTYPSPTQAKTGAYLLTVTFYPERNGQGRPVGVAQANATIQTNGQLSYTIGTTGTIRSVVLSGLSINGQVTTVLPLGQTADLVYSAFDGPNGTGNLLAQSVTGTATGSGVGASSDTNKAVIEQGDRVRAVAPGLVPITVTVDGVTSAPLTLSMRSSATFSAVNPSNPVFVSRGLAQTISVAIANDPTNAGVDFVLLPPTGNPDNTAGPGTFTATDAFSGTYTAPTTTDPTKDYTFTIRATSKYDPSLIQNITVIVRSLVSINIVDPQSNVTNATQAQPDAVAIRQSVRFQANVLNVPSGRGNVTWQLLNADGTPVPASMGTLSSDGTYTAPGTPFNTPIKVRATSVYDPNKFQDFYFIVQSGNLDVTVQ
jgi:hypothetical protein